MRAAMARQAGADRSAIAQQDAPPALNSATKVAGGNTATNAAARTVSPPQQVLTRAAERAAQPSPESAPARPAPLSDLLRVPSAASATQLDRRRGPPGVPSSAASRAPSSKDGLPGGSGGTWLVAAGSALGGAALLRQKVRPSVLHNIRLTTATVRS